MKLFKNIMALGVVGAFALTSCTQEQVGPELVSASSDFDLNLQVKLFQGGVEKSFVNFKINEEAFFESTEFSETVSWNFYVRGLTSGALFSFSGTGEQLQQTDAHWKYGESETIQFFQRGEDFVGELHIAGLDTVFSTDTLIFANDFDWNKKEVNGVKHIVVEQFEVNQNLQGLGATSLDAKDKDVSLAVSGFTRINGAKSLYMTGTDVDGNTWLGDINHERLLELAAAGSVELLPIDSGLDPDDLYFNIYVYGLPGAEGSAVEIKVYEFDDPNVTTRDSLRIYANNALNTFEADKQAISDAWIYDIKVEWEGWKLISVPYSAFRAANDMVKGGGGNRKKESWRISATAVSLLSYPKPGQTVSTYVDYFTMTINGRPQY